MGQSESLIESETDRQGINPTIQGLSSQETDVKRRLEESGTYAAEFELAMHTRWREHICQNKHSQSQKFEPC